MTTTLKRSTTYISPYTRYACSRPGCTGYGRYGTASGVRFCGDDWRRYMIVEYAQVAYNAQLRTWDTVARSMLGRWLEFAVSGTDREIEQCATVLGLEDVA